MWSALRRRCLQSARSKPVHRINRDHDREAAVLQASGEEIVERRVASEDMYRIACSTERETDLADKDRERNLSVDVCRIPLPDCVRFELSGTRFHNCFRSAASV